MYEKIIGEFSELIEQIIIFFYELYDKYAETTRELYESNKNKKRQMENIYEEVKSFLRKFTFRIEKRLTDAIFNNRLKNFLKQTQYVKNNDMVVDIFIPFKLIRTNEINIPVLYVYFKQLKNY